MRQHLSITHRNILVGSLSVAAFFMPLSSFVLSISIIILVMNWLWESGFAAKWQRIVRNPALWLIISVYLVHVAGILWTSNLPYAFRDLKIKLPLFLLPLVVVSSGELNSREFKTIFIFFSLGLITSSLASTLALLGILPVEISDARQSSLFISHIRLSLMSDMAAFIGLAYYFSGSHEPSFKMRRYALFTFLWLSLFVFFLKSLTGIVIWICLLGFTLFWYYFETSSKIRRILLISGLVLVPLIIAGYMAYAIQRYYTIPLQDINALEQYTSKGNRYAPFEDSLQRENGYYIWSFFCDDELRAGWNRRSTIPYDGKDKKGQDIKYTLIRYLSSLGLRKDESAVQQLSEKDIRNIEMGIANYLYANKFSLYPYVHRAIWDIESYLKGGDPTGHSISQRLLYLKLGKQIIREHFWLGTGTGDVQDAFEQQYRNCFPAIENQWRRRAHNQLLTFWISFGLPGFIWIVFALFYSLTQKTVRNDYFAMAGLLIIFLSMLNEDTLETQAGATFVAFCYAVYIIHDRSTYERQALS
jgi:hypothetical protein